MDDRVLFHEEEFLFDLIANVDIIFLRNLGLKSRGFQEEWPIFICWGKDVCPEIIKHHAADVVVAAVCCDGIQDIIAISKLASFLWEADEESSLEGDNWADGI